MIEKITGVYVRTFRDNRQALAYVEWTDERGRLGRTAGAEGSEHMAALFARAEREGLEVEREVW